MWKCCGRFEWDRDFEGICQCSKLEKEQALVFYVFERALADAIGREVLEHIQREAAGWLLKRVPHPYPEGTARWYAEIARMEHVLVACQKVALASRLKHYEPTKEDKVYGLGIIKREWYENAVAARRGGTVRDCTEYRNKTPFVSRNRPWS